MDAITTKRNNQAKDYLRKAARIIVDYCISNDIGTIVCGCNKEQKDGISLGKKTNQSFVQVSFSLLRSQLASLCEHYGIRYIEQEESYTSKASFLDLDEIPVFEAGGRVLGQAGISRTLPFQRRAQGKRRPQRRSKHPEKK